MYTYQNPKFYKENNVNEGIKLKQILMNNFILDNNFAYNTEHLYFQLKKLKIYWCTKNNYFCSSTFALNIFIKFSHCTQLKVCTYLNKIVYTFNNMFKIINKMCNELGKIFVSGNWE